MRQLRCTRPGVSAGSAGLGQKNAVTARPIGITQIYAHLLVSRLTLNSAKAFNNVTTWGLLCKGATLGRKTFVPGKGYKTLTAALAAYRSVGFKYAAAGSVGLSRLAWYSIVRLIRQQRLTLPTKGECRATYDRELSAYSAHLATFERRQNGLLRAGSKFATVARRMYMWLTHVYQYFEAHKQKVTNATHHWTVRLERLFFTPYAIRLLGQIKYRSRLLRVAGRKVAALQRSLRSGFSNSAVRTNLLRQAHRSLVSSRRAGVGLKYLYPRHSAELGAGQAEYYNIFTKNLGARNFNQPVPDCSEGLHSGTFLFQYRKKFGTSLKNKEYLVANFSGTAAVPTASPEYEKRKAALPSRPVPVFTTRIRSKQKNAKVASRSVGGFSTSWTNIFTQTRRLRNFVYAPAKQGAVRQLLKGVKAGGSSRKGALARAELVAHQRVLVNSARRALLVEMLVGQSFASTADARDYKRALVRHREVGRPGRYSYSKTASHLYFFKKWNFLLKILQFTGAQRKPFWLIRQMHKHPQLEFPLFKVLARLFGYGLLAKRLRAARSKFRPGAQNKLNNSRKVWLKRAKHRRRLASRRYRRYCKLDTVGRRRFRKFRKFWSRAVARVSRYKHLAKVRRVRKLGRKYAVLTRVRHRGRSATYWRKVRTSAKLKIKKTRRRWVRSTRPRRQKTRLQLRQHRAKLRRYHKVYSANTRRLGGMQAPILYSRRLEFWTNGGAVGRACLNLTGQLQEVKVCGRPAADPRLAYLGQESKRIVGLKARLGFAGMLANGAHAQHCGITKQIRRRLLKVSTGVGLARKVSRFSFARGNYYKALQRVSSRGPLSKSRVRLRRVFILQKIFFDEIRRLRHREYRMFREGSRLFKKFIYHYVFKVRMAKGFFTKQPFLTEFGIPARTALPHLRHCRLNYLSGRRLDNLVQKARTGQKKALRRSILFVRNREHIYERWASMTKEYSSFGYFRKQRLLEKRRRLVKRNKPKAVVPKTTHPVLGKYWSARRLKLQHLLYRKARAVLQTDTIVSFFYWNLISKFYYISRFNRRVSEKRIRLPSNVGHVALKHVMPKVKYLRTVLKNEMRILRQKLPKLYPSYLFKKKWHQLGNLKYAYRVPNYKFAADRFRQNAKRRLPPYWYKTRRKKFPLKSQKKDWTSSLGFWSSDHRKAREALTYFEGSSVYYFTKYFASIFNATKTFNIQRELGLMLKFRQGKPIVFIPYVHYVQWWRYRQQRYAVNKEFVRVRGLHEHGSGKKKWVNHSGVARITHKALVFYLAELGKGRARRLSGQVDVLRTTMSSFGIVKGRFLKSLRGSLDYAPTAVCRTVVTSKEVGGLARASTSRAHKAGQYAVALRHQHFLRKISGNALTLGLLDAFAERYTTSPGLLRKALTEPTGVDGGAIKGWQSRLIVHSMHSRSGIFTVWGTGNLSELVMRRAYVCTLQQLPPEFLLQRRFLLKQTTLAKFARPYLPQAVGLSSRLRMVKYTRLLVLAGQRVPVTLIW